ncbi:MAG: TlpA disulfide reductase family protein [Rhodanobacter sp.]
MVSRLKLVVLSAAFSIFAPAFASVRYADVDALRHGFGFAPNVRLVFRQADGSRMSGDEFIRRVNQGESSWLLGPMHRSIAVLTIGEYAEPKPPPAGRSSNLTSGEKIPALDVTSLDGKRLTDKVFTNRVTLIDFFGVDCGACIDEIPVLNAFKATHGDVQTLAVTTDPAEYLGEFLQKWKFTWRVAPDAVVFTHDFDIWFYPTLALVDGNGRLMAISSAHDLHKPGQPLTSDDIAHWVALSRRASGI